MDFRFNSCGFWLFLQMIITVTSLITAKDCRTCKPGYYASRRCTENHDTVCKPCSIGTYSSSQNVLRKCSACSKCEDGEFTLKQCTKHRDTICESCSTVTDVDKVTKTFLKDCLHYQGDQPVRSLDFPDSNGVRLQNDQDTTPAPERVNLIYEGSGETIEIVKPDKGLTEIVEGSGETPAIDEADKNITSVILPDETEGKEKVTQSVAEGTTTKKIGVIVTGDGILLKNETQTPKLIGLPGSQGPNTGNNEAPIDNVDVYIEEIQEDATAGWEREDNKPQLGASKRVQNESGGTSIGVVVTVGLVAALVFFILGFLASKFWNGRRERTFNVLEAERLNGKPPVECSNVEFKDSEGRNRNKAGIYDEIPANAKVNGNTADPENGADPVYTKPIKRETVQTTSSMPPAEETEKPEWAGFSISRHSSSGSLILQPPKPRPVSDIKFMDETEDSETDRLLQPTGNGNSTGNASGGDVSDTSSKSETMETKNDGDNETTPMLSKRHDDAKS